MKVIFLDAALLFLFVLLLFCILRAVKGPGSADRIIAVNVGTTITAAIIGIFGVRSDEAFFADVTFIYVILSFMAVVVLVRVYLAGKTRGQEGKEDQPDDSGI
ncbi:MAG: sodium:proton antiporter [Firmicutes bacterium]|jgi:multicomponent Na+:H+ antiporter subunit F|nr:sodium:proton antiporter [Bacillota bacterium]MBR6351830.1 sodium:proton antiporter [Bacillota bacterium]